MQYSNFLALSEGILMVANHVLVKQSIDWWQIIVQVYQPHSNPTHGALRCNNPTFSAALPTLIWSGQWDPFPGNSSREDPTDVGRQDRVKAAQVLRKRLQPMLLLILNGEKSDKSSWHNNACNDLAGKFSKCCSEFIILEDKKSWKKRIFFFEMQDSICERAKREWEIVKRSGLYFPKEQLLIISWF